MALTRAERRLARQLGRQIARSGREAAGPPAPPGTRTRGRVSPRPQAGPPRPSRPTAPRRTTRAPRVQVGPPAPRKAKPQPSAADLAAAARQVRQRQQAQRLVKSLELRRADPVVRREIEREASRQPKGSNLKRLLQEMIQPAVPSERLLQRDARAALGIDTPSGVASTFLTPPALKGAKLGFAGAKALLRLNKVGRAVAKTRPARLVAKAPRTARGGVLAGAVAAEPHSRRFVERHVEATREKPGKVVGTTLRAIPGLVTAPGAALFSVGATGKRLAAGEKRPFEPVEATGKGFAEFTKDIAKIAMSESDAEAKKTIQERYGLTGLAIAAPFAAKAVGRRTKPLVREHTAKTPIGRTLARRRARKDISEAAAIERTRASVESARKTRTILDPAARARTYGHKVNPEDALGIVMEEGLRGPSGVAAVRAKHAARPTPTVTIEGKQLPKDHIDRLLNYLEDPRVWKDRAFTRAAYEVRKLGTRQRFSQDARFLEFQETHGLRSKDQVYAELRQKGLPRREALRRAQRTVEDEARNVMRERGLAEPEKFGNVDILPSATTRMGGRTPPPMGKKGYKRRRDEGSLAARGRVTYTGEALERGTIRGPARAEAAGRLLLRVVERGAIPIQTRSGRKTVVTQAQAREVLFGERPQIDPKRVVFVPQSFKSAVEQLNAKKLDGELAGIKGQLEGDWATLARTPGRKGVLMEREVFNEYLGQIAALENPVGKLLTRGSRAISKAILYNPAWAMSQVPATALTGMVVAPRLVKGLRAVRKAQRRSPEVGDILASQAGRVPGAAGFEVAGGRFPIREQAGFLARAANPRTRKGRFALTLLDSPSRFNRWSEGQIREAAFAANLEKQVDGWYGRMSRLRREQRAMWEKLRGKPLDEKLRIIARNEKAMKVIREDTLAVIGDFAALTRYEKIAAPAAIFYPFMRMSLRFITHGLPVKHPVKNAALHHFAQWNADELQRFLGGDPSFYAEWGTLPLRTGEGTRGVAATLPLTRIAPGGSFVPEAVGEALNSGTVNLLRGLNPIYGSLIAGTTGVDPLSGRPARKGGEPIQGGGKDAALMAFSQLVGAAAPVRLLSTVAQLDRKNLLRRRDRTELVELFEKLRPSSERLVRGFGAPAFPSKPDQARDYARAGRALDLIGTGDKNKKRQGQAMLDELYTKYNIARTPRKTRGTGSWTVAGSGSGGWTVVK